MRFKIKKLDRSKHSDIVTSVGWSNSGELFSVSDDMTVLKWDINGEPEGKVMDIDVPVIDMDWFPTGKGSNEVFALSCTDGSFKLVSKAGRVEKSVPEAHQSAIICIRWSYEGAAVATGGEDGCIKIWSRGGMLRQQLIQGQKPIYSLSWSPENDQILYSNDKTITILPI